MKKWLEIFKIDASTEQLLPYADEGIQAGFPSPAQDYMELSYDLNKELIKNPASTFMGRVKGLSMKDEDINPGDLLIIDKSLEPENEDLCVCFLDGEFTLKRLKMDKKKKKVWLIPSNPDFPTIEVTEDNQFIIWGIVLYTIKDNRRRKKG